jgi:hypothetical protein
MARADSEPAAPTVPAGAPPTPPRAAVQVVTPSAPPPRPAAAAARERSAPGLHIGTLEVSVVAPPPPAPPPAYRPAPSRAVARAPAVRTGGITRGFGVFGLGQS